jgi:hypothetical protein
MAILFQLDSCIELSATNIFLLDSVYESRRIHFCGLIHLMIFGRRRVWEAGMGVGMWQRGFMEVGN